MNTDADGFDDAERVGPYLADVAAESERANNSRKLLLTGCPVDGCDETFDRNCRSRPQHFAEEHSPEDFGLPPLRDAAQPGAARAPAGD